MNFYNTLCNNNETQNIVDYVKARGNTYKLTINTTPANSEVVLNGIKQKIGFYKNKDVINYIVSAEGYTTKTGSVTMEASEKTEDITLEAASKKINGGK
ncbi:hypothetical protein [Brachyspira pilosicoli]|uniref:hypothetical protein n=1 Tax=Brachyspira pilosicoli TaxID=52584 RepID=UPI0012F50A86|nr:hypothetical protein [Brachyspira pilosicoli]